MCAPTLVLFPLLCDPAAQPEEQQILRPPPSPDTILILTTSARGVHLTTFSSRSSLALTDSTSTDRPDRTDLWTDPATLLITPARVTAHRRNHVDCVRQLS